jgi:hypothetical protein
MPENGGARRGGKALERLMERLEPTVLRSNLIRAGLLLSGWELLKGEVQDKVRDFYLSGFDETGLIYSKEYETRVLAKHKSAFEASLLWLVEAHGVTEAEAESIRNLRVYRNQVAHELPRMLLDPVGHGVDVNRVREMRALLAKIGTFWGRIELDTNPDLDGHNVADEDIISGVSLLMNVLVEIAEEEQL